MITGLRQAYGAATPSYPRRLDNWAFAAAFIIVLILYAVHVVSILRSNHFSPTTNVEEAAYTFISAGNYNQFGFLKTGFLQDFATSHDPADHPLVYSHMPPGPDIATALLMRWTGGSHRTTAIIFASIVPLGFLAYLAFTRRLLLDHGLFGGIFFLIFFDWGRLPALFSRFISAPYLLFTFAPLLALQYENRGGGQRLFLACLPLILIASLFLDYVSLSSVAACWLLLYLTQLVRVSGRQICMVLGTIAFGVFLNVFKNLLYFGPRVFFQEFSITFSNRLFGYPTQDAVRQFYVDHGILLHGSRPLNPFVVWEVIKANLVFVGFPLLFCAAIIGVVLMFRLRLKQELIVLRLGNVGAADTSFLVRLLVWGFGTILAPIALFPAFSQEASLLGIAEGIWQAIIAAGFAAWIAKRTNPLKFISRTMGSSGAWLANLLTGKTSAFSLALPITSPALQGALPPALGARTARIVLTAVACVLLIVSVLTALESRAATARYYAGIYRSNLNSAAEPLRQFTEGYSITNINTPLVYFYTQRPVFGVCGLGSIAGDGKVDLSDCKIALMRNAQRYASVRPAYFVHFSSPRFFPGFADCLPSKTLVAQESQGRGPEGCTTLQKERLQKFYPMLFDNGELAVFDLRGPPQTGDAEAR